MCFTVVKTFYLDLSVPGDFNYIIIVIGAHESMITIKNGGNAIYGATLATPTLVPRSHLEKLTSIALALIA